MFYWLLKYIFMGPILQLMGRPKVEGLENIPSSGPAILAGNHLAVVDSFFLPLVCPRRVTFLAKSEYFTEPGFKGWLKKVFFGGSGQVPIDRTSADAAENALSTAKRLLGEGSCWASTRRARARPTVVCTRARPGWRVWRWQPGCRSFPSPWSAPMS